MLFSQVLPALVCLCGAADASRPRHTAQRRGDHPSVAAGVVIPLTKRESHKNLDPLVQRGVVNSTVHSTIRAALASKYARNAENYFSNTGTKMSSGPRDLLLQTSSSDLELRPILRFEPFYAASAAMNAGRFLKINKSKAAKVRNSVDYEGSGSLWSGTVMIGSPPRPFSVDFDTGSADLWIETTVGTDGFASYDASASSTSSKKQARLSISSEDGPSVSGPVYTEVVSVAGAVANYQHFSPIPRTRTHFSDSEAQGILGLGPQTISQLGQRPYFSTLVDSGMLSSNIFSMALRRDGPELFLGGYDDSQFEGSLLYSPLISNQGWMVTSDIYAGDRMAVKGASVLIDSGTSLITGPAVDLVKFFSYIPQSRETPGIPGQYEAPCTALAAADMYFTFDNDGAPTRYKIPGSALILGISDTTPTYCVSKITVLEQGTWILGDAFLQQVYTVFDVENSRMGFAQLKQ